MAARFETVKIKHQRREGGLEKLHDSVHILFLCTLTPGQPHRFGKSMTTMKRT